MAEERKSFPLRISSRLFEEIKKWADDEMRSVNGQIEFLLREALLHRRHRRLDSIERQPDDFDMSQPLEPPSA